MEHDVPELTQPHPVYAPIFEGLPGYRIKPETAVVGKTYLFFGSNGYFRGKGRVIRISEPGMQRPDKPTIYWIYFRNETGVLRGLVTVYNPDGSLRPDSGIMYTVGPPGNQLGPNQDNYRDMLLNRMGTNAAINKIVNNAPDAAMARRTPLIYRRLRKKPWEAKTGGSRKNRRTRRRN